MSITSNITNLTRTNLWSAELKEALKDELFAQSFVRWLTDFPDGDTFNIPSIGEATVRDYTENSPIVYDSLDTGNFTFTITDYKQAGTYITKKAQQDLYYAAQLEASFVPKQARALAEVVETDILSLARSGQTLGDTNSINGVAHRFVATGGTGAGDRSLTVTDVARALASLKKANVPDSNLIAIIDPSVEYILNTTTNLIAPGTTTQPIWGNLLQSGIGSGFRFVVNIFGFDFWVSNYLPTNTASETAGTAINSGAVNNIFMSAASPDIVPFIGAWRQEPEVDSEYNKDLQRWEYLTTARYGKKLYRPENLVVALTMPTVLA